MSYYKVIKGVKYDRKLLEQAEKLAKENNNTISLKHIQQLHDATLDGGGTTTVELWSLNYIIEELNPTESAVKWLKESVDLVLPGTIPSIINRIVKEKYNKRNMTVIVNPTDALEQEALPNNKVSFEQALDKAIISFLSDYTHPESPGALVANAFGLIPGEVDNAVVKTGFKLAEIFDTGKLQLLPNVVWDYEEAYDFFPPEDREPAADNWIFSLSLPDLSDHIFWVIIPRNGESKVYNYGFN